MKLKYERVIFDVDGTIVDSAPGILSGIKAVLENCGIRLNERELLKFIGTPLLLAFTDIALMETEAAKRAVTEFRKIYRDSGVLNYRLYDGIIELIKDIKNCGGSLAIASSKPTVFIEKILEDLNILELFDEISGTGLDKNNADKSEILKKVATENSVLIGDRLFDVNSAKRNNIPCIGALYGYAQGDELKDADYIANDVSEIRQILFEK